PYLAPVPMRGKRNDSRNLQYVVERIAKIKNITPEEVARVTTANAKKLFGIE
ncbi:MAG: TatD family hydrolase, partial [Firmicutes bacterium]|nr:TatD family hydrolase [Bacillota bacterium]